jgi:hypothetical protein
MGIRRVAARVALVGVVAAGVAAVGPGVSGACACGALVANDKLAAQQETALIELSGRRESITLAVRASGQADQAAFLMPVPSRAEFALADGAVFAELDRLTKPNVEVRTVEVDGDGTGGGAPGAGDSGATVVDRVEVGPYDVAQLAGTSPTAVADWLEDNGFTLPADLGDALDPYLREEWLIVAVKLAPTSGSFADGVPPMRLSFDTDVPVYPMRLAVSADFVQPVRLYVLADHRVDITNPTPQGDPADLTFAGPVSADPAYPVLAGSLSGPRFLTRFDGEFQPEKIMEDIRIDKAPTNDPYRATVVVTRYVRADNVALPLIAGGGAAVVVIAAGVYVLRRRSRG